MFRKQPLAEISGATHYTAMKLRKSAFLLAATIGLSLAQSEAAVFIISQNNTNSLFVPTFRDTAGNNANNTTWFGWGAGDFAGLRYNEVHPESPVATDYKLLQGADPTSGASSLAGSLSQANDYNILASSDNIYPTSGKLPAGVTTETVNIHIPINVSLENVGTGFTTIIIQGNTVSSPYGSNPPNFLALDYDGDVQMSYVLGTNNSTGGIGKGQFWVKYDIIGSAEEFTVSFLAGLSGSIAGLTVDTIWSPTQIATDTALAAVPEPSTYLLVGLGLVALVWQYRKRAASQSM